MMERSYIYWQVKKLLMTFYMEAPWEQGPGFYCSSILFPALRTVPRTKELPRKYLLNTWILKLVTENHGMVPSSFLPDLLSSFPSPYRNIIGRIVQSWQAMEFWCVCLTFLFLCSLIPLYSKPVLFLWSDKVTKLLFNNIYLKWTPECSLPTAHKLQT